MSELLRAVGRTLDLDDEGVLRIVGSVPTGVRSDVAVIATRSGDRLLAKRFLGTDAERRFEAELTALQALNGTIATVPRCRGADRESLVVIMDASEGPTVEDLIRGTDRVEAERGLIGYAKATPVDSCVLDASEGAAGAGVPIWYGSTRTSSSC